jgi:hypothetical protein
MKVVSLQNVQWRGKLRGAGSELGLIPEEAEQFLQSGVARLPTEEELAAWQLTVDDEDDVSASTSAPPVTKAGGKSAGKSKSK